MCCLESWLYRSALQIEGSKEEYLEGGGTESMQISDYEGWDWVEPSWKYRGSQCCRANIGEILLYLYLERSCSV